MQFWERLTRNFYVILAGAAVAVMTALAAVKAFATDTFPWLLTGTGGWFFVGTTILAIALALYAYFRAERYRKATRTLMWRYIIDVQEEQRGKPGRGEGQSEAVKRGEDSADREWGDGMYREVLHLPPEDDYKP